jgi:phosphopantetheinyl transferase
VSHCDCQLSARRAHDPSPFVERLSPLTQGAAERPAAPEFVESWRKQITRTSGTTSPGAIQAARVEIWIAPVRSLVRQMASAEVLSSDEALQFGQVRVSTARDSLTAGRMLLRLALSRNVQERVAPKEWRLTTSPTGRPEIAADLPQLHFSVAHTERLAVIAVSRQLPVGVDAETIEQTVEKNVVSNFCCPGERAALQTLPTPQYMREFIRLWTLKEAYAKLTGLGAAIDFSSLGFSFDSLHLAHGPALAQELPAHFETMFVANGNGLSHVSLAIGMPPSAGVRVDLQVVTLVGDAEPSAIQMPCVFSHVATLAGEIA